MFDQSGNDRKINFFLKVLLNLVFGQTTEHCKKYQLNQNTLQIKVVDNSIFHKKLCVCTRLSPPGVELRDLKIAKFEIYNVLEWESTFTFRLNALWIIFIWSTFLYTRFSYSVHPKTDASFPLQYIIIFQKW